MTAQRILLIAGGILVVGLVFGLVYALRADGPARPQRSSAPAPTDERPPPRPEEPPLPPPRASAPSPAQAPVPPASAKPQPEGQPEGQGAGQGPIVRDHRGQGPSAPPSPIAGATIIAVRQALDADLKACAEGVSLPPTDSARVYVHATLRVAGGRVTAGELTLTGADGLGQPYSDCVRRAVQGLSVAAPATQTDGEDIVHMPLRLP